VATAADLKTDLLVLQDEGQALAGKLGRSRKVGSFEVDYQRWYTRALPLVKSVAADRFAEFRGLYEGGASNEEMLNGAYAVQDYLRGVPLVDYSKFDKKISGFRDTSRQAARRCLLSQAAILGSLEPRAEWARVEVEDRVRTEIQETELEAARCLIKFSARAAGTLAGAVLELHLKRLCGKHRVKLAKQKPHIRDYAEALHLARVLESKLAQHILWLANTRDRCALKQDAPPKKAQARDLIDGTHWLIKNVF